MKKEQNENVKRTEAIINLIKSRGTVTLSEEFKVNKEGMDYLFIDICQEAAMAGANKIINIEGGDIEEGMKVVESNPISFAKTVLKGLRKIAPMGGTPLKDNISYVGEIHD